MVLRIGIFVVGVEINTGIRVWFAARLQFQNEVRKRNKSIRGFIADEEQMRTFFGRTRPNHSVHHRPGIGIKIRAPTSEVFSVKKRLPTVVSKNSGRYQEKAEKNRFQWNA